jgi:hypothetical protein
MRFCVTPTLNDVPRHAFDALDNAAGVMSCYSRVRQREADGRWRVRYLCGWTGEQLAAVVPLYTPRAKAWPDPAYDPHAWGLPGLDDADGQPGRSLLVGGCADLRSSLHVGPEVRDSGQFAEVLGQLAGLAAAENRCLVFPYLLGEAREAVTRASGGTAGWQILEHDSILPGVSEPGWEDRQRSRVRQYLRRDRRLIAAAGVDSQVQTWAAIEDMGCDMVAAHNLVKGTPDHPEFARMRYREWSSYSDVECLAFTARAGDVQGIVAALIWNDDLELHELGLDEGDAADRVAVYLEILFRLPLEYARSHGLHNIRLGPKGERAKAARGAVLRELHSGVINAADVQHIAAGRTSANHALTDPQREGALL